MNTQCYVLYLVALKNHESVVATCKLPISYQKRTFRARMYIAVSVVLYGRCLRNWRHMERFGPGV
jgi:hypothetical protein